MSGRNIKLKYLFVFEQDLKREKQEWKYMTAVMSEAGRKGIAVFIVKEIDDGAGITEEVALRMLEKEEFRKNCLIIAAAGYGVKLQQFSCPLLCLMGDRADLYGIDMLAEGFEEVDVDFLLKVYNRHYGLPLEITRTSRCVIRESVPEDLESFYEIYDQPSVRNFLPPLSENFEEEAQKLDAYIRNQYGFYDYGIWTVEDSVSGKIIGRAGFEPGDSSGCLQMGYLIREEYQCRGYGLEVCEAVLRYAREKLQAAEVVLFVRRDNIPSVKLAEKLGFRECPSKNPGDMQLEHSTKHCFFRKI